MRIAPFETEEFFARWEFRAPYLLSASDCETLSVGELLSLAGRDFSELGEVRLGYTESQGDPELRAAIAESIREDSASQAGKAVTAGDVVVLNSPVEGIYLTFRSVLEPGDEAVVLARNVSSGNTLGLVTDGVVPLEKTANLLFGNTESNERIDGALYVPPPPVLSTPLDPRRSP